MSNREFVVRVHEEDDSMWAEVLDLPGCFASGDNLDELFKSLEEAISLYLHDRPGAEKFKRMKAAPKPAHMQVDELRVKVPA